MAVPTKVWVVIPTVLTSTPIPIVQHLTEEAANTAAVKAAIVSGAQQLVLEAVSYAEPDIPPQTISALVLPIP